MNHLSRLHTVTRFLILFLFIGGLFLAYHKTLWNDETYSQLSSVENTSVSDVISGQVKEGNNSPLFYLLQKGVSAFFGYRTPSLWHEGTQFWTTNWPGDKIILRIVPVSAMTLSIAAIFYYFARFYSFWVGALSLFLSLSTTVFWQFWAEARHYPLWFFLTTMELLLFLYLSTRKTTGLHLCRVKKSAAGIWNGLIIVHLLLSLTVIFSLAQIVIVSALLYFFVERRWQKYVLLTAFPVAFCLIYYALAPKYDFWLMFSYEQYIRAGISRDRLYIVYLFTAFLALYGIQIKAKARQFLRHDVLERGIPFLWLTGGMIAATCLIIFAFQCMACPSSQGFPVTTRYFINLAPVGIIAATLFAVLVIKSCGRMFWTRIILASGMGYLFIHRVFKILPDIQGHFPLLFSSATGR